jgi:hypothetical protein
LEYKRFFNLISKRIVIFIITITFFQHSLKEEEEDQIKGPLSLPKIKKPVQKIFKYRDSEDFIILESPVL